MTEQPSPGVEGAEPRCLLRQIHPSFIQDGRVSSQAFRPTPKDQQKLSAYHGDMIGPEAAWRHYVEELRLGSVGVLEILIDECHAKEVVVTHDRFPFPEHCSMDFGGLSRSKTEQAAKFFAERARGRGWRFRVA